MLSDVIIEVIGAMAGLLGVIAWLPQLHRVMIQRLHEGISMPTLLTICLALVLWIIYGFLIDSMAIIGSNIAAGTCVSLVAARVTQLRRLEHNSK
ncbi:MAG: hypothetical protein CL981_03675 [Euryarchaeota archaeon]|nr:hypothetical protein [Euryarchaeota archaeon]